MNNNNKEMIMIARIIKMISYSNSIDNDSNTKYLYTATLKKEKKRSKEEIKEGKIIEDREWGRRGNRGGWTEELQRSRWEMMIKG